MPVSQNGKSITGVQTQSTVITGTVNVTSKYIRITVGGVVYEKKR